MKTKTIAALMITSLLFFSLLSCNKEDEGNETKISTFNSTESHKAGENCMSCHKSGGEGEGWFTAAGTVYDDSFASTFPNATVRLYTGPNGTGTLKATLQVDGYGNFYTTENIDFGSGLYTSVEGNTVPKHMISSVSSGKCNSCHGAGTDPIWTK